MASPIRTPPSPSAPAASAVPATAARGRVPARITVVLAALLALVLAHGTRAAANELKGGGFEEPAKARHGERIEPPGFTLEGGDAKLTRFVAPAPHERAVGLKSDGALEITLTIPKPPTVKKIAPDGWYGVASVDVLGMAGRGRATLELSVRPADGRKPIGSARLAVTETAPRGGKGTARSGKAAGQGGTEARQHASWLATHRKRLWVKIPSKRYGALAGKAVVLRLAVEGSGRVVLDDLRLDRFHDEPGRPLVGKPNGKDGPDLLASGALGFTALTEHGKTAFSLLQIREKGPAAKAGLQRSDLVVAVDGVPFASSSLAAGRAWFASSHEAALGRAIETALAEGRKTVRLTVLRDGGRTDRGPRELEVKLPFKTGFADTFPFDDPLVDRLQEDMLRWIAEHQKDGGAWPGSPAVNPFMAGLALLGTRDRKHRGALRKLVGWMLETNPTAAATTGFSYWSIAFQGIFLCEYYLASGDKRALAWIEDAIAWLPSTTHESAWGMQAFGHSPKGLPYGKKALMAPCAHLLVFEALAEQCGVKSKVWKHIEPYVMHSWSDPKKGGHGAMGYNAAAKDKAQFWSRTGLTALALHLRGHKRPMQKALTAIMVERHPWMLNSHAYGEPGAALGLLGLAVVHPKGFAEVMPQWRWRFLNAWEPGVGLRYSSPHMGSPYMGEEEIVNPAYALLFAVRNGGLVIAGGTPERWLAPRR